MTELITAYVEAITTPVVVVIIAIIGLSMPFLIAIGRHRLEQDKPKKEG